MTSCYLNALGNCEAQLSAHIRANINAGNNRQALETAALAALPFNGYPRTLNTLRLINKSV